MSNLLDVRAKVYCNLGPVISGNLQDTSAIGAGLVSTSGVVLLDGVYQVTPGDKIELAYYKDGRVARLGRSLRVLSVYANPMTRTTELGVGCYLAYQANHEPPPKVIYSEGDPNTPNLTALEAALLIKPTSAKYLVEQICDLVGITHAAVPLTNVFYKKEFTLQGPYLQTLAALLVSEGFIGYMDSQEVLQFIDLKQTTAVGPIFDESNIIDANPIQDTAQTADIVYSIVNHMKLKLDPIIDAGDPSDSEPPYIPPDDGPPILGPGDVYIYAPNYYTYVSSTFNGVIDPGDPGPPILGPGDVYIYGPSIYTYVSSSFNGVIDPGDPGGPDLPPIIGPDDVYIYPTNYYTYLSSNFNGVIDPGDPGLPPVLGPGDISIYGRTIYSYIYTDLNGQIGGGTPPVPPSGSITIYSSLLTGYGYFRDGGVNDDAIVIELPGDYVLNGANFFISTSLSGGSFTIDDVKITPGSGTPGSGTPEELEPGDDLAEDPEDVGDRNDLSDDFISGIIGSGDDIVSGGGDDKTVYGYDPTPDDEEGRSYPPYWTTSVSDNGRGTLYFRYQEDKNSPAIEEKISYTNISETRSFYDSSGKVTETITKRLGPWGISRQETYITYVDYPNYSQSIETVVDYVPAAEVLLACGIPSKALIPLPGPIRSTAGGGLYLKSRITTVTTAVPGTRRTVTTGVAATIFTSDGAQAIQTYIRSFTDIGADESVNPEAILARAGNLRTLPTRVEYSVNPKDRDLASSSNPEA